MKKLFTSSFALLILFSAFAQDCKSFLYMTNNAQMQMTMYNNKQKETGVIIWTVSDVKKTGSGLESTIHSSMKNDKGKEISTSTGNYKCTNGVLQADVKMSMPQGEAQTYDNTDAKIDPVYLEYPNNITVGQALKDADFKMDVERKGGMKTNVSFKEVNRKVDAKENITTPAGTWEAYVISYDATFRTQIAGIGIPINFSAKEWFVPGIGIVKSETYRKDKLIGSSVLTSITK